MISHLHAMVLVALFTVALLPTEAAAENQPVRHPIEWKMVPNSTVHFRMDYENSQRLEHLDSRGQPIRRGLEKEIVRQLSAELRIDWNRLQRSSATGILVIDRILGVDVGGFQGGLFTPKGLKITIRVKLDQRPQVKIAWKAGPTRQLLHYCQRNIQIAEEIKALIHEGFAELSLFFPPSGTPIARAGEKWEVTRVYELERECSLQARFEFEHLGVEQTPAEDKPLATIEGAIRQEIPGAESRLSRHPGLFPGVIKWTHDLAQGFPHLLSAEKIATIPIADKKLPTITTLTHTYRLRVGDPAAFGEE